MVLVCVQNFGCDISILPHSLTPIRTLHIANLHQVSSSCPGRRVLEYLKSTVVCSLTNHLILSPSQISTVDRQINTCNPPSILTRQEYRHPCDILWTTQAPEWMLVQ